jgi:hypothetical protein
MFGIRAEIRTEYLPNASQKRYSYDSQLSASLEQLPFVYVSAMKSLSRAVSRLGSSMLRTWNFYY